jgi:hypothetical protein
MALGDRVVAGSVAAVAADQADRLELLRGSCARDGGGGVAHIARLREQRDGGGGGRVWSCWIVLGCYWTAVRL